MTDKITVISHHTLRLAKLWRADGTISPFDDAKNFVATVMPVANLRDLSETLTRLEGDPHSAVVRGVPNGREDAEAAPGKVRKIKASFDDAPHHWLLIEIDKYEPSTDDPIDEFIRECLPSEFAGISYRWQFSSSSGSVARAGKLSAHLWFWLAAPRTSEELKAWADRLALPVDKSVFNVVQFHYTAAPLFEKGVADPVRRRSGFVEGLFGDEVTIDIPSVSREVVTIDDNVAWLMSLKPTLGWSIDDARKYLQAIDPNSDRETWLHALMALHHEFDGSAEALDLADEWSSTATSYAGRPDVEGRWRSFGKGSSTITGKWLLKRYNEANPGEEMFADFYAYLPTHKYLFVPTRDLWPAESVDKSVGEWPTVADKKVRPSAWLDMRKPLHQMTWAPAETQIVTGRAMFEGGWKQAPGLTVFNLYSGPEPMTGDPSQAGRWLEHVRTIYADNSDHIIRWLAHRVQRPGEKINHALVLAGSQGIGKDTLLDPVKCAVGPWNWAEINPAQMLGRFNGWIRSVVVRVSEARDLGDVNRYQFYEASKTYMASPPDALLVDEKNLREHYVQNVLGMIITTNNQGDGLYLPADDRRHYVAWSEATKEQFAESYWRDLYAWLDSGGRGHVAAYLRALDLSGFDAKAPPPKTPAFWVMVQSGEAPESGDLRDAIDRLPDRTAFTLADLIQAGMGTDIALDLADKKQRRQVPHKLLRVGYVPVRNDASKDGLWVVGGRRQAIYADKSLPHAAQLQSAKSCASRATGRGGNL